MQLYRTAGLLSPRFPLHCISICIFDEKQNFKGTSMTPDSSRYYGTVSRLLHWLMAVCFVVMLVTAIIWNLTEADWVGSLYGLHKSFGFILMVLIVVRILWAAANMGKRPPADSAAAKLGHLALYALMLFVPLVGMIRQYGSGRGPLKVFGLQVMQGTPEKVEWMANLGNMLHGKMAWLLFVLVAGHIAMVIVHRMQGNDVLPRMLGRRS